MSTSEQEPPIGARLAGRETIDYAQTEAGGFSSEQEIEINNVLDAEQVKEPVIPEGELNVEQTDAIQKALEKALDVVENTKLFQKIKNKYDAKADDPYFQAKLYKDGAPSPQNMLFKYNNAAIVSKLVRKDSLLRLMAPGIRARIQAGMLDKPASMVDDGYDFTADIQKDVKYVDRTLALVQTVCLFMAPEAVPEIKKARGYVKIAMEIKANAIEAKSQAKEAKGNTTNQTRGMLTAAE